MPKPDPASLFDLVAPLAADPRLSEVAYISRGHDDYSTPPHYIERCRAALGGSIACDPASSDADNRVVRAASYYTHSRSGLDPAAIWASPVFLNPPASRR